MIRAFIDAMGESGRPQGGSTITQQLAKNLLVGDTVSYERKIREMIVASRMESTLTKDEILELYLNTIFLGRSSWGVEMAARSYFGKSVKDLSIAEGALLAGLTKGPNAYSPDKNPERARERITYVLSRMKEDGAIDAAQVEGGVEQDDRRDPGESRAARYRLSFRRRGQPRSQGGRRNRQSHSRHLCGAHHHPARTATGGRDGAAGRPGKLRTHQRAQPRSTMPRSIWRPPSAASRARPPPGPAKPAWQRALENARLPLYDVHWTPAIIVDLRGKPAPAPKSTQVGQERARRQRERRRRRPAGRP